METESESERRVVTDSWVADAVQCMVRTPLWVVPIAQFIDVACCEFEEGENKLIYMDLFEQYQKLVNGLLFDFCTELSITTEQFLEAVQIGLLNDFGEEFQYIYSLNDFETFKNMMIERNKEITIEVMELFDGGVSLEDLQKLINILKENAETSLKKVQGKLKKAIELVKDTFGRKVELDGLEKLPSNNITEPIKETKSTSQNSTLHKIEQKEERNDDDEDDEMKEAIALSLKLESQRKDLEVRLGLSQILERPMTANQVIKQEKQADQRPSTSIVVNTKGDSPTVQAQPSTPQKRPSTQSSSSSEKSKIVSKSVSSSKVLSPSKPQPTPQKSASVVKKPLTSSPVSTTTTTKISVKPAPVSSSASSSSPTKNPISTSTSVKSIPKPVQASSTSQSLSSKAASVVSSKSVSTASATKVAAGKAVTVAKSTATKIASSTTVKSAISAVSKAAEGVKQKVVSKVAEKDNDKIKKYVVSEVLPPTMKEKEVNVKLIHVNPSDEKQMNAPIAEKESNIPSENQKILQDVSSKEPKQNCNLSTTNKNEEEKETKEPCENLSESKSIPSIEPSAPKEDDKKDKVLARENLKEEGNVPTISSVKESPSVKNIKTPEKTIESEILKSTLKSATSPMPDILSSIPTLQSVCTAPKCHEIGLSEEEKVQESEKRALGLLKVKRYKDYISVPIATGEETPKESEEERRLRLEKMRDLLVARRTLNSDIVLREYCAEKGKKVPQITAPQISPEKQKLSKMLGEQMKMEIEKEKN
eukprot:TRINITY_DN3748_c0_g1_i1.p1 TRINITY_DN3748_c0_g1~~TRINITY_DN3748_c0_g1_i1.p1  ORF type:complete len:762 (-),score=288.62 TRINITY_DN3748_c0_g1_i1:80-2365(-)